MLGDAADGEVFPMKSWHGGGFLLGELWCPNGA
jgi:hypothetical protein